MNKLFLLFISLAILIICIFQNSLGQNIVPNSGFEHIILLTCARGNLEQVANWEHPISWPSGNFNSGGGSADYWNTDCPTFSYQPHSGKACIGGYVETDHSYVFGSDLVVEYTTAQLLEPVIPGQTYFYSYFVKAVDYQGDKTGIGFSMEKPKQKWTGQLMRNFEGITVTNNLLFEPNDGWIEKQGTFVPDKAYNWITIGCFDESFISFDANQFYL